MLRHTYRIYTCPYCAIPTVYNSEPRFVDVSQSDVLEHPYGEDGENKKRDKHQQIETVDPVPLLLSPIIEACFAFIGSRDVTPNGRNL